MCEPCRRKALPPTTPWEDTRQDYSPRTFGRTLKDVITSPRSFFRNVRFSPSWKPAVVFGVVCMTLGLLFSTTWQLLLVEPFVAELSELATQAEVTMAAAKVATFATIPIRVGLGLLAHLLVFHLAVKLAGGKTYLGLSARIVGYASAGYVWLLVPPVGGFAVGHFLAVIWLFNIETGALRMYFQMSIWRSVAVVLATVVLIMPFFAF